MKRITTLILIFFIAGCAPMMTYEEMTMAYTTASTPEEKEIAGTRLKTFEKNAEKATIFYEGREICMTTKGLTWYCSNASAADLDRIETLERKVNAWKREHRDCGCVYTEEVMRLLRGRMR